MVKKPQKPNSQTKVSPLTLSLLAVVYVAIGAFVGGMVGIAYILKVAGVERENWSTMDILSIAACIVFGIEFAVWQWLRLKRSRG